MMVSSMQRSWDVSMGDELRDPIQNTGRIPLDYGGCHQMIDFALEVHDPNTKTQQKHAFDNKQANFELFKEKLSSINYEELMLNINAENCY
ncbi:hypothetical protein FHG87_008177 [Trinorchestia longiramus]|nr:hypothetical protein FHG87_008177 [Trinorchestia longiramus]